LVVIIGPLGTIKKGLDQNLQFIVVKVWRRLGRNRSKIVPAQDQAISTNYFKNKILEEVIVSKCRFFKQE